MMETERDGVILGQSSNIPRPSLRSDTIRSQTQNATRSNRQERSILKPISLETLNHLRSLNQRVFSMQRRWIHTSNPLMGAYSELVRGRRDAIRNKEDDLFAYAFTNPTDNPFGVPDAFARPKIPQFGADIKKIPIRPFDWVRFFVILATSIVAVLMWAYWEEDEGHESYFEQALRFSSKYSGLFFYVDHDMAPTSANLPIPKLEKYYGKRAYKYTLFIDMDALVDIYMDPEYGPVIEKRAGCDHFILTCAAMGYEIVLWGFQPKNVVEEVSQTFALEHSEDVVPICLSQNDMVRVEGAPTRVITGINRNMKKVIMLDTFPHNTMREPQNAILIGSHLARSNSEENQLYQLLPFLKYLRAAPDFRDVIGMINSGDLTLREFIQPFIKEGEIISNMLKDLGIQDEKIESETGRVMEQIIEKRGFDESILRREEEIAARLQERNGLRLELAQDRGIQVEKI